MDSSFPPSDSTGVWFVYDGDCPLCQRAAAALRIRRAVGPLTLLDARQAADHPLMAMIRDRGFDLDDGMVIYHRGAFYHGADALHFMAAFGETKGFFNRINRLLFQSPRPARFCYPPMRAVRNLLLRLRGRAPIRNLAGSNTPIFQPIFGAGWDGLPLALKRHYANRPFCTDQHVATGTMTVWAPRALRLLAPLSHAFGALPVADTADIPVTVTFLSEPHSGALVFDRAFHLPGHRRPHRFRSRMVPQGDSDVDEVTRPRLVWRSRFAFDGTRVQLTHRGYAVALFGWHMPLPITWLLGRVSAWEQATGNNTFDMCVEINHWLFGCIYVYRGTFTMNG